jgi:hypothetical protein
MADKGVLTFEEAEGPSDRDKRSVYKPDRGGKIPGKQVPRKRRGERESRKRWAREGRPWPLSMDPSDGGLHGP